MESVRDDMLGVVMLPGLFQVLSATVGLTEPAIFDVVLELLHPIGPSGAGSAARDSKAGLVAELPAVGLGIGRLVWLGDRHQERRALLNTLVGACKEAPATAPVQGCHVRKTKMVEEANFAR